MHTNELGVMCMCVNAMYTSHSYTKTFPGLLLILVHLTSTWQLKVHTTELLKYEKEYKDTKLGYINIGACNDCECI